MTLANVTPRFSPDVDATQQSRATLLDLLQRLDSWGYDFVTTTPNSHAHVLARPERTQAQSLRDVFGWSIPFSPDLLAPNLFEGLRAAGLLTPLANNRFASTVRVSRVLKTLFLHSAYPTTDQDSVFLGPDSYRFANLIVAEMGQLSTGARILDYGAGAGVGGIVAATRQQGSRLTIADINPKALYLAGINAEHAGCRADTIEVRSPADLRDTFDLIVTHPPFMIDTDRRAYRDGGDLYGARLSLDWVLAASGKLNLGGRLILHTGVSIVDGEDVLRPHLARELAKIGCTMNYHELDPDIFGDELARDVYRDVDRIAAVGATIVRAPD
jgi:methylase of polypeptide subunit release factors